MPSLLSRFHRSPSQSSSIDSSHSHSHRDRHYSNASLEPPVSINSPGKKGSFVEHLDRGRSPASPNRADTPSNHRPLSLNDVPRSASTPKVVLTEEGATSPRSVQSVDGVSKDQMPDSVPAPTQARLVQTIEPRLRSTSVASTRGSRSSSVISPRDSLAAPPAGSKKDKKKRRKSRTKSVSSALSAQSNSIAAALAKGGLHIAGAPDSELVPSLSSKHRSPFLVRRHSGEEDGSLLDDDYDEDDSGSDFEDGLPVTGFAVASNRRQSDFHALFPGVDEGDYLIEDYGCALSKDILVHGRLYVSENHLCFHANIFGWVTDLVIPFVEIRRLEKKMTALVIPNAIGVVTNTSKYTFASFISRDPTYDVMMNIWRLCNPNAVMSTTSFQPFEGAESIDSESAEPGPSGGHAKTKCLCEDSGKHYPEVAMNTTFPSKPEKIYNLMFNSEFLKHFMVDNQHLQDVETTDWQNPGPGHSPTRKISYIKPLNGSIGPKQTKCHITDELQHCDNDVYITLLTTTRTPDVPSGGVFSVKTRTCLTWAGANSTHVLVTSAVEWTGKSWVKGIIEKSAVDGQKQYHHDLEHGMREHIKAHSTEFYDKEQMNGAEAPPSPTTSESKPTAAEAYAAQQRKQRQDRDVWWLQGGIDHVVSGSQAVARGLWDLGQSLFDYMSDLPGTKGLFLGFVILLLIFSNIYTYVAFKSSSRSHDRRIRRLRSKTGLGEEDFADAMKMLLADREMQNVAQQGQQLQTVLDEVEKRVSKLRESLGETKGDDTVRNVLKKMDDVD